MSPQHQEGANYTEEQRTRSAGFGVAWAGTARPSPQGQARAAMGAHCSALWGEDFLSATLLLPHRFTLPSPELQETLRPSAHPGSQQGES